MDKTPLNPSDKYVIKHGVNDAQVKVISLSSIIHTDFSGKEHNPKALHLNEIGEVILKTSKPLFVDAYNDNKENGAFIIINPKTNTTSGVGFIN